MLTAAKPRRRGGRNVFYVGSSRRWRWSIAACALFARAFNQLAQADVYEQTFWDSEKNEEILLYMIRFPNSGFKIQALSPAHPTCAACKAMWLSMKRRSMKAWMNC